MAARDFGRTVGARCPRWNGHGFQRSSDCGASVQAKNHDTGVVSTTASTSVGVYRFAELPLGTYDITASAPGFKNAVLTGVQVQIQNVTALDITLQVGQRTESVVVDAGAPHVEAESSTWAA